MSYNLALLIKDLQAPDPIHTYITIDKVLPIQYDY